MEVEETRSKRSLQERLYVVPRRISLFVESFFYRLGLRIAHQPKEWILGACVIILLCLSGLSRFHQEKNPLKLWVPPNSDFVRDTEWLMSNFQEGLRVQNMIFSADDVLEPAALVQLNEITKRVLSVQTKKEPKIYWNDVCFKVPILPTARKTRQTAELDDDFFNKEPKMRMDEDGYDPGVHAPTSIYCNIVNKLPLGCTLFSIMDIWEFNSDLIASQTKEEIVEAFNAAEVSPTIGHSVDFQNLLGGVTRDSAGRIVAAKAVKTQWFLHVNFTAVNMDDIGNDAGTADWATSDVLNWEAEYLRELQRCSEELDRRKRGNSTFTVRYEAGRSFGDISSASLFQDIDKLIIGIILMSIYVQVILSKFNWVEWRFCLTSIALLSIGAAFIVAVALCSLFGVSYGPVHTSLPFMLMGLGVDDTFVMMASWEEVVTNVKNKKLLLPEKVALALSHAGAAITVTSITDVIAFLIGALTILPSLQSFCIYAAAGVFVTYILQVTVFVAFFVLDAKRIEEKRNGVIPCIRHEKFEAVIDNSKNSLRWKVIDQLYGKVILTWPGRVSVLTITLILSCVGSLGSYNLEQWFDPVWFLPKGTYLSDYIIMNEKEFPNRGHAASVFIGDGDIVGDFPKILNLSDTLKNMSNIDLVKDWPADLVQFVKVNYDQDISDKGIHSEDFRKYLSKFLFSRSGGRYQGNFKFHGRLSCGEMTPPLHIVSIDFVFKRFKTPHQWISGMDEAKKLAFEADIRGFVTVWSKMFGTWVTDKVISQEVTRNLILALVCVMGTTSFLIAEPQTCFWILLCVLLTLLDVCGFMFYWGLTIDIVSCIGLELAVGLSVDYAAHVAHAFLHAKEPHNKRNGRRVRTLKAVRHIGAAVLYGAGSTLLALSLLSFSQAYVFRAFFKIFLLVIVFGLWHGLVMLPVILSTIGPKSLRVKDKVLTRSTEAEETDAAVEPLKT